jgi:hypothetical protein
LTGEVWRVSVTGRFLECQDVKETLMVDAVKDTTKKATDDSSTGQIIVLDFGSRSRRKIKRLRKGEGPLMDRVNETVAELKHNQSIPASAAVVVVVVKQRDSDNGIFG